MMEEQRGLTSAKKWILTLGLLVLFLGLANLVRAGLALRYGSRLPDLPMTLSFTYLAGMGAFWGLAFLVSAAGLVFFRPWSRWFTLASVTMYQGHVWINHLLFDASDYARQRWPFSLMLTGVLLAIVWGLLSWPSIRKELKR